MSCHSIITGLGLITPLGISVGKTWSALLAGRFVCDHARVANGMATGGDHAARSRVEKLALSAAREAIEQAGWKPGQLRDPGTALVIGTSKGPAETWLAAPPPYMHYTPCVVAGDSLTFGLAQLAAAVGEQIGHGGGPRTTLSAACASGIHALIHATLLLRGNHAERTLVIAAEASVHPLFIGSFKRLGVLPPDGVGCRPFDMDRQGFLVSEAAAAVCLESDETGRTIARVERFALAGDATHLTASDPGGKALKTVLRDVIAARPVDLIHAHATGTQMNDEIELAAIEANLAGQQSPPNVYSHKGALGHSLGAAGLVSVVLNCMSHRSGIIPPNVQTHRAIATRSTCIATQAVQRPVHRSVAIAAGFGGAMGAVSLVS